MKRVAALDLGTNTFLCLIADIERGEVKSVHYDQARVVRLGQDVAKSRRLHPDALRRAEDCFAEFQTAIRQHGAEQVLAVATSAARDATNAGELFQLGRKYGIPIEIIDGNTEAECTFAGTFDSRTDASLNIIDVGGGSTEFISGDHTGIQTRLSVDVGSVRLTEMFIHEHPIPQHELDQLDHWLKAELKRAKIGLPKADIVTAVAGTPTTLAAIDQQQSFSAEKIEGYQLPLERIEHWVQTLAKMSVGERQRVIGMDPKRADVIVAGALVLLRSAENVGAKIIRVSTRGLRYGVAKRMSHLGESL